MPLTDYEKYIRTEELLSLQKSAETLTCHDEMQFQVVHQVSELWMKLIEHELNHFGDLLAEDHTTRGVTLLRRVSVIQRGLINQIDLLDTMAPKDYITIRSALGRGSGQESPGFKTMLRLPGEVVWPAFAGVLDRALVTLRQIYETPEAYHILFRLAEGLVDYDQLLQSWRYRHLMLVYRVIGAGTPSLKGKSSDLLASGMKQRFFPELWAVRDELFAAWTSELEDVK